MRGTVHQLWFETSKWNLQHVNRCTRLPHTLLECSDWTLQSRDCRSKAADKAFFGRDLCRSRDKSSGNCKFNVKTARAPDSERLFAVSSRILWGIVRHRETVWIDDAAWCFQDSTRNSKSCIATWFCKKPNLSTNSTNSTRLCKSRWNPMEVCPFKSVHQSLCKAQAQQSP